jgi:hypothetical protein
MLLMMKNTLFATLLIFVMGNLCHAGLPWWALAPIAAVVAALLPLRSGGQAFNAGFLGGSVLWYATAFLFNAANAGALSAKVGQLFLGLQGWQLLMATGVLGGVLGGLGALTGKWARDIFARQPRRNYLAERRR